VLVAAGFVALGFAIGTLGTLIGAGGGFILLPVLALLFPLEPTGTLTATSLAVVAANATSGAIAYGRQRRIDYRSGLAFAIATLPGSVVGALLARSIPRGPFDTAFALVLLALAIVLLQTRAEQGPPAPEGRAWGRIPRTLVDAEGTIHRYHVELPLGIAISFIIGFASSLLGIGGVRAIRAFCAASDRCCSPRDASRERRWSWGWRRLARRSSRRRMPRRDNSPC